MVQVPVREGPEADAASLQADERDGGGNGRVRGAALHGLQVAVLPGERLPSFPLPPFLFS